MSKHAFWQALIFSVLVFGAGLLLGFFLESSRADKIQYNLIDSEINVLDDEVRNRVIKDFDVRCNLAIESTFNFADKIYLEAAKMEQYDGAAKFSDSLDILHRRYDLLRTLLWTESIELKEKCSEMKDFHTVVYLYQYETDDVDIDSKQLYFSRLLFDLKLKYPDEIILIPIAADTNLESVNLITRNYGIFEYPTIIIDEEEIISEIVTLEEIENVVFQANN
jgi:hypothetical protein